jgi:hypothetical protein
MQFHRIRAKDRPKNEELMNDAYIMYLPDRFLLFISFLQRFVYILCKTLSIIALSFALLVFIKNVMDLEYKTKEVMGILSLMLYRSKIMLGTVYLETTSKSITKRKSRSLEYWCRRVSKQGAGIGTCILKIDPRSKLMSKNAF